MGQTPVDMNGTAAVGPEVVLCGDIVVLRGDIYDYLKYSLLSSVSPQRIGPTTSTIKVFNNSDF